MWTLIYIGTTLLVGLSLGYYIGGYFLRQENRTIQRQLELQKQFSEHWAAAATGKEELSKRVAEQQVQNVNTTMQTVIALLHSFQVQQANTASQEDKQKVEKIINQVKDNFIL